LTECGCLHFVEPDESIGHHINYRIGHKYRKEGSNPSKKPPQG
jgi:hypothetical protein